MPLAGSRNRSAAKYLPEWCTGRAAGCWPARPLVAWQPLAAGKRTAGSPTNAGTATRTLDLAGAATGVYLLRLRNADGVETRRLIR